MLSSLGSSKFYLTPQLCIFWKSSELEFQTSISKIVQVENLMSGLTSPLYPPIRKVLLKSVCRTEHESTVIGIYRLS